MIKARYCFEVISHLVAYYKHYAAAATAAAAAAAAVAAAAAPDAATATAEDIEHLGHKIIRPQPLDPLVICHA